MPWLEFNLQAIGLSQIVLALIHLGFERRFAWKEDLKTISRLNQQLMYVHTFFVAFVIFLNGCLSLFAFKALLEPSGLGIAISLGLTIFWALRLFFQFFVFDRSLWIGRGFETVIHLVFGVVWLWYAFSYGLIFLNQNGMFTR